MPADDLLDVGVETLARLTQSGRINSWSGRIEHPGIVSKTGNGYRPSATFVEMFACHAATDGQNQKRRGRRGQRAQRSAIRVNQATLLYRPRGGAST